MPINGASSKPKITGSVQKPTWLKDDPVQLKSVKPAWAKSKSIVKQDSKSESSDGEKKDSSTASNPPVKKEVKLQSREIKVPQTIEKRVAAPPPLKKPEPKVEPKVEPIVEVKKEPKIVVIRNSAKLPSKSPTPTKPEPPLSKSTTPSKSPTPLKSSAPASKSSTPTSTSKSTTPSKSPSKTPDYTEESDDDTDFTSEEEEETEEEEEETESESESEEVSLSSP